MARYGNAGGLTPFLDSLAERSLVLDQHSSCSNWTLEAVLCATNGRYSADFDYVARVSPDYRQVVPARPSLASWLHDAGYYTILLTSNGWLENEWHHDDGYDVATHVNIPSAPVVWARGYEHLEHALESEGADRWFLHLHFNDPHAAYDPPDEYLEDLQALEGIDWDLTQYDEHEQARFLLGAMPEEERDLVLEHLHVRYRGEIAWFDQQLSQVFDEISQAGLLEDTLVVLWSDHGEQTYERERWGHAFQLHPEETAAFAMFASPDIEPGSWTEPTQHIDIAPTVLDLLGIETPAEVTGVPVGLADPERTLLHLSLGQLGPQLRASRGVLHMYNGFTSGDLTVFDAEADPDEVEDIRDLDDAAQAALWTQLEAYAQQIEPLIPEYERGELEL